MARPVLRPADFHAHVGGNIAFLLGVGETSGGGGSRYSENIGEHADDVSDYRGCAETAISRLDNARLAITHKKHLW